MKKTTQKCSTTYKYIAACSKLLAVEGFTLRRDAEKRVAEWNQQAPCGPHDAETPPTVYSWAEWVAMAEADERHPLDGVAAGVGDSLVEAIAQADAYTNNAGLYTYSDLARALFFCVDALEFAFGKKSDCDACRHSGDLCCAHAALAVVSGMSGDHPDYNFK